MREHSELHEIKSTALSFRSERILKDFKYAFLGLLFVSIVASCQQFPAITPTTPQLEEPESKPTYIAEAPTASATLEATVEPTATKTEIPLEGRLFFDMNGSGLADEASFNYDAERLTDERQPLQPDLLAAVEAYVAEHPTLKDGDLITIGEPGLSNYTLCTTSNVCATTGADGGFVLPGVKATSYLKITDPNAGTPALEMRYINKWNKAVTVKEYTKDVDANTMASLKIVPGCEEDAEALVCKLDEDTLLVREQHLNDTEVLPISKTVQVGKNVEIGLMQGFLTLPFVKEQVEKPFIISYFDIIGNRIFSEGTTYSSTFDGVVLNFDGRYNIQDVPHLLIVGTGDSHTGLDYLLPVGNLIISGVPISHVWYIAGPEELRVNLMFNDPTNNISDYDSCYGHLDVQLVTTNQTIYRGQILGLSGNTGTYVPAPRPPMLHFHIAKSVRGGWNYIDPYRYTVELDPLPANFWGSEESLWSSDNIPQFPLLNPTDK